MVKQERVRERERENLTIKQRTQAHIDVHRDVVLRLAPAHGGVEDDALLRHHVRNAEKTGGGNILNSIKLVEYSVIR